MRLPKMVVSRRAVPSSIRNSTLDVVAHVRCESPCACGDVQSIEVTQDLVVLRLADLHYVSETTHAKIDPTLPLTGLASVCSKSVVARFDGPAVVQQRRSGSGRGGNWLWPRRKAAAWRRASGALHRRFALCGPDRPQLGRHDRLSHKG